MNQMIFLMNAPNISNKNVNNNNDLNQILFISLEMETWKKNHGHLLGIIYSLNFWIFFKKLTYNIYYYVKVCIKMLLKRYF